METASVTPGVLTLAASALCCLFVVSGVVLTLVLVRRGRRTPPAPPA